MFCLLTEQGTGLLMQLGLGYDSQFHLRSGFQFPANTSPGSRPGFQTMFASEKNNQSNEHHGGGLANQWTNAVVKQLSNCQAVCLSQGGVITTLATATDKTDAAITAALCPTSQYVFTTLHACTLARQQITVYWKLCQVQVDTSVSCNWLEKMKSPFLMETSQTERNVRLKMEMEHNELTAPSEIRQGNTWFV